MNEAHLVLLLDTILRNQQVIMRVLGELLQTPGVTAFPSEGVSLYHDLDLAGRDTESILGVSDKLSEGRGR